jgi:hypothetical protein
VNASAPHRGFAEHGDYLAVTGSQAAERARHTDPPRGRIHISPRIAMVCVVAAAVVITGTLALHKTLIGPPSPEGTVQRFLSAGQNFEFTVAWDLLCLDRRLHYQDSRGTYVAAMWSELLEEPENARFDFTVGEARPAYRPNHWLIPVQVELEGTTHRGDIRVVADDGGEYLVC